VARLEVVVDGDGGDVAKEVVNAVSAGDVAIWIP
jgi:hypothetical protein